MRNVPPEVIASWPEPNYVNPETRADSIIIAAAVCIPVVLVVFVCRIYSRLAISKYFGWDDWLIIPSVLSGVGYSCITLVGIRVGWYKHIWDLQPSSLINVRKLVIASNFFGLLNVAFTKLSILSLYLYIAPPSRFQIAVYILLTVTTSWLISLTVTNFLICIPLHAYWEFDFKGESTCVGELPYYVAFTTLDLALDTVIYILPLPILIPLKMPKRQKIILMGVFGLGILVIASTALRFPSLVRVSKSYDLSWELYDAALWTEIESTVGIFCACAPALKPLIQRYIPAAFGSFMSTRGTKGLDSVTGTVSRRTINSGYVERRMTEDMAWRSWNHVSVKHGSDVGLVHELGFIPSGEHIEDGRGRSIAGRSDEYLNP